MRVHNITSDNSARYINRISLKLLVLPLALIGVLFCLSHELYADELALAMERVQSRLEQEAQSLGFTSVGMGRFLYGLSEKSITKDFPVIRTGPSENTRESSSLEFLVGFVDFRMKTGSVPGLITNTAEVNYSIHRDSSKEGDFYYWDGNQIVAEQYSYSLEGTLEQKSYDGFPATAVITRRVGEEPVKMARLVPAQFYSLPSSTAKGTALLQSAGLLIDYNEKIISSKRIDTAYLFLESPLPMPFVTRNTSVVSLSLLFKNNDHLQPEVPLITEAIIDSFMTMAARIMKEELGITAGIDQESPLAGFTPGDSRVLTALPESSTTATILIVVILIASGVAVQLATSIATAIAQAIQAAVEFTSDEVSEAIARVPKESEQIRQEVGPKRSAVAKNSFDRNDQGEYWAPDTDGKWRWMGEQEATKAAAALGMELTQREGEIVHHQKEAERIVQESRDAIRSHNQEEANSFLQEQAEKDRQNQIVVDRHTRLVEKVRQAIAQEDSAFREEAEQLLTDGNFAGLEDLYRNALEEQVGQGQATSEAEQEYERRLAVGEQLARATVAASKGALMAVGGPAGMAATGIAVGTVSAGEEGAESLMRGDDLETFTKKTVGGFVGGFKDGAASVFTNLPGTGKVAKTLVPLTGDIAETYVRTGDASQALASGVIGVVGDQVTGKIDSIDNLFKREASSAMATMVSAEATNVAQGGNFGDAYETAFINHLGAKAGGKIGGVAAGHSSNPELSVRKALDDVERMGNKEIPLEQQSATIQELAKGMQREPVLDSQGRPRLDANGQGMETVYTSTRGTLDQLQDTTASRTAKRAPEDLRQAIIATRADKIYGPADARTIERVTPNLLKQGLLHQGDSLEMDTFSTPGSGASLGADRDARLVIKRPKSPDISEIQTRLEKKGILKPGDALEIDISRRTDAGMAPGTDPSDRILIKRSGTTSEGSTELPRSQWEQYDRIEVKREHWERIAQKDFYDHTTAIARSSGQEITEASHPEYFRRRDELGTLRRPDTPEAIEALQRQGYSQEHIAKMQQQGLSREEIDHQAWAEAHNQLFTDKNHMEASRDNSDQAFETTDNRLTPIQKKSNILDVQEGKAQLADPEGFGRMWTEKSNFYSHNQPEAIAQAQKGIKGLMKVRDGYRSENIEPPPILEQTAKAMVIITKAPVGVDATSEAMTRVESQLQDLGYRDTNDALTKMASQYETLKWSKTGEATASLRSLDSSDQIRIVQPKNAWAEDEKPPS